MENEEKKTKKEPAKKMSGSSMFGSEEIKKATEKAEDRAKNKKEAPPDIYAARIEDFQLKTAKSGNPMYVIEFAIGETPESIGQKYNNIITRLSFSETNTISRDQFVELCSRALKLEIKPVQEDTLEGALKKMYDQMKKKLEGALLRLAVKTEIQLYNKTGDDGGVTLGRYKKAIYWFPLHKDDITTQLPEEGREKVDDQRGKARTSNQDDGGSGGDVVETGGGEKPSWLKD